MRLTCTLDEDLRKFIIMSRQILLGIRNISDKFLRENQNTYFRFIFFFFKNLFVCEIAWKNTVYLQWIHKRATLLGCTYSAWLVEC